MPSVSPCPADIDEVTESYTLGTLPQNEVQAFEEHYLACDACALAVQNAIRYLTAMRAALTELRSEGQPAVMARPGSRKGARRSAILRSKSATQS